MVKKVGKTLKTVTVVLTCHNRCSMTVNCIKRLKEGNRNVEPHFIVVDDGSIDETQNEILYLIKQGYDIALINGTGDLYWAGGMRVAIDYAKQNSLSEFYVFINDDVAFNNHVLDNMLAFFDVIESCEALVGATCNSTGQLTYGGVVYTGNGIKYSTVGPDYSGECDTFNMNCVMLPKDVFMSSTGFDANYVHGGADFDFGMQISRRGGKILMYDEYVGICNHNNIEGTWRDNTLGRLKRIKLKESVKGLPFRQWFYYINKYFGIRKAIYYSLTPYIKILLGK